MEGSDQRSKKLTVAQILTRSAGAYVQKHARQAAPQVQSTLAKLSLCRTQALGGRTYKCPGCAHQANLYNSCGDRHCPTCSGARRSNWLESTSQLIFEGVDHFQVVFTLPAELSRLALGNRKAIYDLLFASAWKALKQTMAAEHGIDSAAAMVLHTWNQKLDAHAHVHAVVAGCGPAIDGSGLRVARRSGDDKSVGKYLVDAQELRSVYRGAFIKGLNSLHARGDLKLTGEFEYLISDDSWQSLITELRGVTWVSYIQAPPVETSRAEHVLKYLANYLAGGPISDHRIVATDENTVTFMARTGETTGGERKQEPITLSHVEFTRRWCLHVLPKGYTRTRRFGGWSNVRRDQYLELFAKQLDGSEIPLSEDAMDFGPFDSQERDEGEVDLGPESFDSCCPRCSGQLIPHSETSKPSWAHVMGSRHRPSWYKLC